MNFNHLLDIYFYRLCLKVLNDDKKLWEDEVYKFARKQQLEVGYDFLQKRRLRRKAMRVHKAFAQGWRSFAHHEKKQAGYKMFCSFQPCFVPICHNSIFVILFSFSIRPLHHTFQQVPWGWARQFMKWSCTTSSRKMLRWLEEFFCKNVILRSQRKVRTDFYVDWVNLWRETF